jgi:hypothetical protein
MTVAGKVGLMSGLMLAADQQRAHALANHYLWIRPSLTSRRLDDELLYSFLRVTRPRDLTLRQCHAILTNPDILYRVLVHRFGMHPSYVYGDMFFMTEQLPNPASRVRLSTTRRDGHGYPVAEVDWQLTDADFDGFERYTRLLFEHGLRGDHYKVARRDDAGTWRKTVASAAHHLGTARMGESEATGVVDKDLKVYGVDNLYVSDGSVFTTAGAVNPSLTITALGLRLAAHLRARNSLPAYVV